MAKIQQFSELNLYITFVDKIIDDNFIKTRSLYALLIIRGMVAEKLFGVNVTFCYLYFAISLFLGTFVAQNALTDLQIDAYILC